MQNNSFIKKAITILSSVLALTTNIVEAKESKRKVSSSCSPVSAPTSLVIDARTGRTLHSLNADEKIYPASLTKLMTLKLTFDAVESGKLSMNRKLYVSKLAEKMLPSKLGLKEGETITVKDAIDSLIVKSANDSAVVLAEALAGSEAKFAMMMNAKARQLGMRDTNFENASGWHHISQKTTARDIARLSLSLKKDHPTFYPLLAQTSFEFRGKTVYGHNRVAENYNGVEQSKTGFTCPSGYNLMTLASRGGKALLGVVTGSRSHVHRNKKMVQLLDEHFGEKKAPVIAVLSKPNKVKINHNKKKVVARS